MADRNTVSSDFGTFARRAKERTSLERVPDSETETRLWLDDLNSLYSNIEDYLKEFTEDGLIIIEKEQIALYEELLGSYLAPKMIIRISDRVVELVPVGTYLIGAKGRVDIKGDVDEVRLVRVPEGVRNAYDNARRSLSISVSVNGATPKAFGEEQAGSQDEAWSWKITTPPPADEYVPLDRETFLETIMKVAGA